MSSRYGQYCPVALATEILGERWTILIVLVLCDGVTRFSDMQRALPRIPASTLSSRLRSLETARVVRKKMAGGSHEYHLTDAGKDLAPIIYEMAYWGQRWARDLEVEDLDPLHLVWSVHLRMNTDAMPTGRTTIQIEFTDLPQEKKYYWLVVNDDVVDVCIKHPGHEPDVTVACGIQRFVEAWRGFRSMEKEVGAGRIKVSGPPAMRKAFPAWLLLSGAAHIERQAPGRERSLQRRSRTSN